jgi:hypothetical protein
MNIDNWGKEVEEEGNGRTEGEEYEENRLGSGGKERKGS